METIRNLTSKFEKLLPRKEIMVLRGPRQAGKTTLLHMLEKKIANTFEKYFLDMDLPEYRHEFEADPLRFVQRFKGGKPLILVLDEIQKCAAAGEKLKIIYDNESVKLIVSGSSSLEVKTDVLPPLVGRAFVFELFTFNFEEFLKAKDIKLASLFYDHHLSLRNFLEGTSEPLAPSFTKELLDALSEYLIFGGYPAVVSSSSSEEKRLVLNSIRQLHLEKDVAVFFHIYDTASFEDFIKILAFQTASLLSLSSLAQNQRVNLKKAREFLEVLRHTYIIQLLRPFYRNLNTELKKSRKIYFLDLGLRNSVIGNFQEFDKREDQGKLLENFLFRELVTNFSEWELRYWRTTAKAEVDFVLLRGDEIIPIEVKMEGKAGRSFTSFCQTYKPKRAIVATWNRFAKEQIGQTVVYYLPAFYF